MTFGKVKEYMLPEAVKSMLPYTPLADMLLDKFIEKYNLEYAGKESKALDDWDRGVAM